MPDAGTKSVRRLSAIVAWAWNDERGPLPLLRARADLHPPALAGVRPAVPRRRRPAPAAAVPAGPGADPPDRRRAPPEARLPRRPEVRRPSPRRPPLLPRRREPVRRLAVRAPVQPRPPGRLPAARRGRDRRAG